mmetsp:Transcript_21109/g.44353  ORF Transcript_21109/g.44353 Transcript_21109/m.44353 type:complete len:243 (+) Transcript_21109:48-776(+)
MTPADYYCLLFLAKHVCDQFLQVGCGVLLFRLVFFSKNSVAEEQRAVHRNIQRTHRRCLFRIQQQFRIVSEFVEDGSGHVHPVDTAGSSHVVHHRRRVLLHQFCSRNTDKTLDDAVYGPKDAIDADHRPVLVGVKCRRLVVGSPRFAKIQKCSVGAFRIDRCARTQDDARPQGKEVVRGLRRRTRTRRTRFLLFRYQVVFQFQLGPPVNIDGIHSLFLVFPIKRTVVLLPVVHLVRRQGYDR